MAFETKFRLLGISVLALAFAQTGFAQNSCSNFGTPTGGYVNIECDLYYNQTPNSFDLSSLMTEDGSLLSNNDFGASYLVIIDGDPATLADNSSGLFDESLWEAVLYFPGGDPDGADYSDMLDVFWPGDFPSASTVQAFNESIYGAGTDADFFVDGTPGAETVIGAGSDDVYDVYTAPLATATPEPASVTLMATGLLGLGLLAAVKQRKRLFGEA